MKPSCRPGHEFKNELSTSGGGRLLFVVGIKQYGPPKDFESSSSAGLSESGTEIPAAVTYVSVLLR